MSKRSVKVIGSAVGVIIFISALIYQIIGALSGSSLLDIFH